MTHTTKTDNVKRVILLRSRLTLLAMDSLCRDFYCISFLTVICSFFICTTESCNLFLLLELSYAVCVIQVKVHLRSRLRLRLKLMSPMTSQDRICVQCVTNGLQRKEI